jgi:hypothetical protein
MKLREFDLLRNNKLQITYKYEIRVCVCVCERERERHSWMA